MSDKTKNKISIETISNLTPDILTKDINSGLSTTQISKKYNVSFQSIKRLCTKYNLSPKRGTRIPHNKIDLIGKKFGQLTVVEESGYRNYRKQILWKCYCVCGNYSEHSGSDLRSGKIKTCGCRTSIRSKRNWRGGRYISRSKWNAIKSNARQRNYDLTITLEYIDNLFENQNQKCALSGMPLSMQDASLDRINSKIGYIPENVQWVHKTINLMKQNLTDNTFIYFCKLVALHHCPNKEDELDYKLAVLQIREILNDSTIAEIPIQNTIQPYDDIDYDFIED